MQPKQSIKFGTAVLYLILSGRMTFLSNDRMAYRMAFLNSDNSHTKLRNPYIPDVIEE